MLRVLRLPGDGDLTPTSPRLWTKTIGILLVLSVTTSFALGADASGKIKVIGTGKACSTPILAQWFTTEPSTDPLIIPTRTAGTVSGSDLKRYMRIYFPRNYEELLQYDHFFMAQVDLGFVSPKQQRWIYEALTQHRKGGVNTRSIMSMHAAYHLPWRDSILSQAFPNDVAAVVEDIGNKMGEPGPLTVRDEAELPNIMKAYKEKIEPLFSNYHGMNTVPKPGSVILSYTSNNVGLGYPIPGQIAHVFYWRWNNSITFTFRDMVGNDFWSPGGSSRTNPYSMDIVANVIWFSVGRELPEDAFRIHDLRRLIFDFGLQKNLLVSLLDFSEKFGADPSTQYRELREIEELSGDAADLYLEMDFDPAHEAMERALQEIKLLQNSAVQLKDTALMWVYVVDWLVTTSMMLISGFVLWSLMVRRKLYKQVRSTRWQS